jgi:hypothetical protein
MTAERVGISEASLIAGLSDRKLRELAPTIPGSRKELSQTNTPIWVFDEAQLRGWVAGTVKSVVDEARATALAKRFPCEFYMRGPFMRAWKGHPDRLYFIGCEATNHVKIGIAFKPALRLRDLQQGCPLELTLLAEREGSRAIEMYVHEFYSAERVRGEWFTKSDRICEYINRLKR